jgi:succinoglycan biosynthesis transport protein ExoP
MDLIGVLRVLQSKLWILILIPVLTVVCSAFFISRMDKKYKSMAQIATGFTTDDAVKLNDGTGTNPFEISTNFTNIIESMNSIPVLSLVSYRLILHDLEDPKPFREYKASDKTADVIIDARKLAGAKKIFQERLEKFKPLNSSDPDDRVLYAILKGYEYNHESLVKKLWINRVSTSDFISVECTSENAFLSALTVNAVCQEFIRYNKALKVDRSSESIEFLEGLVKEKKKMLDEKTGALNSYKVSNNVVNYTAESESKIGLIADYELAKEKEEKNVNGLRLSLAQTEEKIKNFGTLNQQEVIQVNQRIIDLRRQITDLNNASGDNKVKINELRDELQLEISRLESINKSTSADELKALEKTRDQYRLELNISQSNLGTATDALNKLKYDVSGFSTKEAKLSDLEREVEFASDDYAAVQDKYNTAKNKALVIGSSIRQTLLGQPSYEAEPSKALLLMALAGAGSLALCVIVILSIEYVDFTIRISSRLERLTGLRNIGSLNLIKTKGFDLRKTFNTKNIDKESEIFVHFLRKLRYEVQTSKSKVFLVTSTQVKVGKSFTIICLSYTLSLINKRVLIIDTNFRHNSLTRLLLPKIDNTKLLKKGIETKIPEENEPNRYGPATEAGPAEESAPHENSYSGNEKSNGHSSHGYTNKTSDNQSIIYSTEFNGVDIIGNVGGHDSPSEILAGRNFKEVIENLSSEYDYILMEGPSLNEYSDTKELIEYADRVITLFGAETTLNHLDKESVSYLKSVKGKFLGTVLNKVQLKDLSV